MIVAGMKKALGVTSDSGRVEVKADFDSGCANIQFDDVEIDTSVETLDELLLVLGTLYHYAESLDLHEIVR